MYISTHDFACRYVRMVDCLLVSKYACMYVCTYVCIYVVHVSMYVCTFGSRGVGTRRSPFVSLFHSNLDSHEARPRDPKPGRRRSMCVVFVCVMLCYVILCYVKMCFVTVCCAMPC